MWNGKTKGDSLDWVAKTAAKRRQPPPEIVEQRPVVTPENLFWWNAYLELATERTYHGLIPASRVREYAALYSVPYHILSRIISEMETAQRSTKRGK